MSGFIVGQRWVSGSEPELGLGLILEVSASRVTVLYLAAEERRVYASDNCPLTRVRFKRLDKIESLDGLDGAVVSLVEEEGLIRYEILTGTGEKGWIDETNLNHHLQFNKPQDRLFMGRSEAGRWFSLRYETWLHMQRLQQSSARGLLSARASLIPHQIYIAHEVASRDKARIMLADEVGLGKTIEAGMILQYRLRAGLSSRVIILVPDSLLHQWLVEMWRRFNLRFSLFDEERCTAIIDENPFISTQLVLCSLDFFEKNPHRKEQAVNAEWDIVVVDEAHHLQWSENEVSDDYLFVEQLAIKAENLILLTATPEQQGKESHFAQLRLLDADRFFDYAEFIKEELEFEPVAQLAKKVVAEHEFNAQEKALLMQLVDKGLCENVLENKLEIIDQLIDRHGTGRVLFRNSRHVIKGFPERQLHCYALEGDIADEQLYINWLLDYLSGTSGEQVLLICQQAETVVRLQKVLRDKHAINAATFHEGMSIIERDRAAAYFSDEEAKVQILLCSEIGSEGRNFQFVHHLILLDLPENPDLLQQRIGRLDRIGQKQRIQIYVPYVVGSQQHSLCRWYSEEGLSLFQKNSNAAGEVYRLQKERLREVCVSEIQQGLGQLLESSKECIEKIEADMHQSRDILLELNSCRQDKANELISVIRQEQQANQLWQYLEEVFECFGVDSEYHSENCAILQLGELQRVSHFPWVPEDGVTVTVDRSIALAREDMQYLTWEHPMLVAVMEMLSADTIGNAAVSIVENDKLESGGYLLECLFVIECSAPSLLQVNRFLPVMPIRVLIDQKGKDLSVEIPHNELYEVKNEIEDEQMTAFIVSQQSQIEAMIAKAEVSSELVMMDVITKASAAMLQSSAREIKRLKALGLVNAAVKPKDLQAMKDKAIAAHGYITEAKLRLDAVRFIISS
jgi:ATP-dependent helicase HepA